MIDHEEVALIQARVENASQNRLVVRQKLLFTFGFLFDVTGLAYRRVLFLNDLHQCANVAVLHLGGRQIDKCVRVQNLHCVFAHELELHHDHIVLDVFQVDILSLTW